MLSPIWGPFDGPTDAADNLCKFTDLAAGPGLGIVWISSGKMYAIRKPSYNANGEGEIVAYEFGPIPPPKAPPPSAGTTVTGWFGWLGAELAKGEAVVKHAVSVVDDSIKHAWKTNFGMTDHQSDGLGVVLDAVGVGLSFALMSFGPLEVLGTIALIGGLALLVADGVAYATEMTGHEDAAKTIKYYTFWPRCVATVMTLPDAVWGVGKVLADAAEMTTKVASSASTAERALADASRVTKAGEAAKDPLAASRQAAMAQKYAEIGAAAQRRAQARQLRLAGYLSGQTVARAAMPPGIVFLTKESLDDPENRPHIQDILKHFTFHVTAVHR